MIKVLVPTDFSTNSKAGLRFAMHWSTQQKIELVFLHIFHVVSIPQQTSAAFKEHADKQAAVYVNKLESFVQGLYKSMNIKPGKYSCIARLNFSADIGIMDYCRSQNDFNFICIATRGAGKLNKLFGTNTGNLITKSDVPVITVPKKYRTKSISHLLYATDFSNYKEELKKVVAFARPLKATIEILHITWPNEILPDRKEIEKVFKAASYDSSGVRITKTDLTRSMLKDLQDQFTISKPSIGILFTDQHRSFFKRFFSPSKSEQLSFKTEIPLLVFQKR